MVSLISPGLLDAINFTEITFVPGDTSFISIMFPVTVWVEDVSLKFSKRTLV